MLGNPFSLYDLKIITDREKQPQKFTLYLLRIIDFWDEDESLASSSFGSGARASHSLLSNSLISLHYLYVAFCVLGAGTFSETSRHKGSSTFRLVGTYGNGSLACAGIRIQYRCLRQHISWMVKPFQELPEQA